MRAQCARMHNLALRTHARNIREYVKGACAFQQMRREAPTAHQVKQRNAAFTCG